MTGLVLPALADDELAVLEELDPVLAVLDSLEPVLPVLDAPVLAVAALVVLLRVSAGS